MQYTIHACKAECKFDEINDAISNAGIVVADVSDCRIFFDDDDGTLPSIHYCEDLDRRDRGTVLFFDGDVTMIDVTRWDSDRIAAAFIAACQR